MSFWSGSFIWLLFTILFWGVVIYLIMHLIRKMSGGHHGGCCGMHGDDSRYLDIVKERYAKGEIDRKQFEDLKKGLTEDEPNVVPEK